jgi:hypothetical protein
MRYFLKHFVKYEMSSRFFETIQTYAGTALKDSKKR